MSMLLFYVGESGYVIDSSHIFRIIPWIHLKKMPAVPHYIAGLLNLGGKAIPVIDFCQFIERRSAHPILSTRIIIVKDPTSNSERLLGIIGEHIKDFLYVQLEEFHSIDFNVTPFLFINRVYSRNSEMFQYVDLQEFFAFLSRDLFQTKEVYGS